MSSVQEQQVSFRGFLTECCASKSCSQGTCCLYHSLLCMGFSHFWVAEVGRGLWLLWASNPSGMSAHLGPIVWGDYTSGAVETFYFNFSPLALQAIISQIISLIVGQGLQLLASVFIEVKDWSAVFPLVCLQSQNLSFFEHWSFIWIIAFSRLVPVSSGHSLQKPRVRGTSKASSAVLCNRIFYSIFWGFGCASDTSRYSLKLSILLLHFSASSHVDQVRLKWFSLISLFLHFPYLLYCGSLDTRGTFTLQSIPVLGPICASQCLPNLLVSIHAASHVPGVVLDVYVALLTQPRGFP